MVHCQIASDLEQAVDLALKKLIESTTAARAAFQKRQDADMLRLDKELENALGEKERAMGALREHRREHGC